MLDERGTNIRLSGVRGPPFKLPIFTLFENFREFLMFFGFFSKTVNGTYIDGEYTYFESADENTSFSYKIMIVYIKDQIEGSSLDLLNII